MLELLRRIFDDPSWTSLAAALVGVLLLRDVVRAILGIIDSARDLRRHRDDRS